MKKLRMTIMQTAYNTIKDLVAQGYKASLKCGFVSGQMLYVIYYK